jgi:hypothetical protein
MLKKKENNNVIFMMEFILVCYHIDLEIMLNLTHDIVIESRISTANIIFY